MFYELMIFFFFNLWNFLFIMVASHGHHVFPDHWKLFVQHIRLTTKKALKLCITGHLWEESISEQWIPLTKGQQIPLTKGQ